MNTTLAAMFGEEWMNVRTVTIEGVEMHMAHDICKILGITNVTFALKGVTGVYNVSPKYRTKEKIEDWNHRCRIHLLTIDGVLQMILSNKSDGCRKIKEYIATEVLAKQHITIRYRK